MLPQRTREITTACRGGNYASLFSFHHRRCDQAPQPMWFECSPLDPTMRSATIFVCTASRNCSRDILIQTENLGGRGGIRTHGGFPHARFRVECLKPDSATLPRCRIVDGNLWRAIIRCSAKFAKAKHYASVNPRFQD